MPPDDNNVPLQGAPNAEDMMRMFFNTMMTVYQGSGRSGSQAAAADGDLAFNAARARSSSPLQHGSTRQRTSVSPLEPRHPSQQFPHVRNHMDSLRLNQYDRRAALASARQGNDSFPLINLSQPSRNTNRAGARRVSSSPRAPSVSPAPSSIRSQIPPPKQVILNLKSGRGIGVVPFNGVFHALDSHIQSFKAMGVLYDALQACRMVIYPKLSNHMSAEEVTTAIESSIQSVKSFRPVELGFCWVASTEMGFGVEDHGELEGVDGQGICDRFHNRQYLFVVAHGEPVVDEEHGLESFNYHDFDDALVKAIGDLVVAFMRRYYQAGLKDEEAEVVALQEAAQQEQVMQPRTPSPPRWRPSGDTLEELLQPDVWELDNDVSVRDEEEETSPVASVPLWDSLNESLAAYTRRVSIHFARERVLLDLKLEAGRRAAHAAAQRSRRKRQATQSPLTSPAKASRAQTSRKKHSNATGGPSKSTDNASTGPQQPPKKKKLSKRPKTSNINAEVEYNRHYEPTRSSTRGPTLNTHRYPTRNT